MIQIINQAIDTQSILKQVQSDNCGAVVLFLGTTRQQTDGRETLRLEYECYETMATRKFQELHDEAKKRWPIENVAIVHRIGVVEVGEESVAVAVSSPHRQAAFDAANWLIDTLKQVVPIWKRENWADGTSEWVHPG